MCCHGCAASSSRHGDRPQRAGSKRARRPLNADAGRLEPCPTHEVREYFRIHARLVQPWVGYATKLPSVVRPFRASRCSWGAVTVDFAGILGDVRAPMTTSSPFPSASSMSGVDDLLSRTRSLQKEQRAQRDAWFAKLEFEFKEDALFELEVLLKATACFANPRNHTGPLRRTPIVALDFRQATSLFRDGMQRAVTLTRQLLGTRD